jgi:hypothetical protein
VSEQALEALERLRVWSQDDLHLLRSARMHEPVYANPAALRSDIRALLDHANQVKGELAQAHHNIDHLLAEVKRHGR